MAAPLLAETARSWGARTTVSLDGTWEIGDSVDPGVPPATFQNTVAVPGLVRTANPPFPEVDHYETRQWLSAMIHWKRLPEGEMIEERGHTRQPRNFYWYRRTFRVPAQKQRAVLTINKAQFGTAVWLNGRMVGEHMGCFTPGRFYLTDAVDWSGENLLLIRIGAHPGAMAASALYGTDIEKQTWTAGIYDNVSLQFSDGPHIESVQVAPRIRSSEIIVETELLNPGPGRSVSLTQQVKTWKDGRPVGTPTAVRILLGEGERKVIRQTISVPDTVLWSPANPFLYVLDTTTDGDAKSSRFGMRELRFEDGRAVLNGEIIYLRGASITLHRFFADPNCGNRPWDEAWLRKLLVEIPRRMNWNAFRICIGPPPQRWLDIADEAGLLLQLEFPIWDSGGFPLRTLWKEDEVVEQVAHFVRDNWNHPSVVLWDASNETRWPFLSEKLVPTVRKLDLSGRPWENGYMGPGEPGDPFELHPYKFNSHNKVPPEQAFRMADLETSADPGKAGNLDGKWPGHASIINEYGHLWLHRDGRPTGLTAKAYNNILGPAATSDERFAFYAYSLAGLTEYWRAFRRHAGVLYLAYLDGDSPNGFTCDNFRDVRTLEFQPYFEDYVREAFKPLGVYIHFWKPELQAGTRRAFRVMMINDSAGRVSGMLRLTLEHALGGRPVAHTEVAFDLAMLGQADYDLQLEVPNVRGNFLLRATAEADGTNDPTVSRRHVTIVPSEH